MPQTDSHSYDPANPDITARIAAELVAHEGIVREAYRDSVGVWTWSVGLTDASGHKVGRYRDNPQSLTHCLEIFIWALRRNYLPEVLAAFGDHQPAEHELAAALSFHWNTGGILRAQWMKLAMEGSSLRARSAMLNWARPVSLLPRRRKEQALFFDGKWSHDGNALVYDVAKPSYRPINGRQLPIMASLGIILGTGDDAKEAWLELPLSNGESCTASGDGNWFARLFGKG
ncbi:lysozyme [Croceicoccus mobilis]|uniref:Lysozyme n=1 Tax=Croceicoccus mobilis TaxID=1703339 RepID=A0A916Z1P6_9SPHN|nr:hypothetical protein [Croceicoccus mobilis]GGD71484.1 hypothetical protein GCM10010990_21220 [Croceicoccus mobilis]